MGCWGMGIAQSDEFCEIYDRFMDAYNEGLPVADISAKILAEYHKEFSDDNGILHDVYFALAKAEWICCEQSQNILTRVQEIIESQANITFYRELEVSEADLKLRAKNLSAFWTKLQTPRVKPKPRRSSPSNQDKELPPVEVGDCYAYKFEEGYRVAIILDRYFVSKCECVLVCVLKNTYKKNNLRDIDYLHEPYGFINGFHGNEFLGKSSIRKIDNLLLPADLKKQLFGDLLLLGLKKSFKAAMSNNPHQTLSDIFTLLSIDYTT